jgi:outer membrane protein TolC
MHLTKSLRFCLLLSFSTAFATQGNLLSNLKKEIIKNDQQKNELNSDNLEKSWINSINGTFSYKNSDSMGENHEETNTLSISINQPIFKSGGIFYAIKYANADRNFLRIVTKSSEQSQIKTTLSSLYNIKKIDLQLQKQKLLIANAKIDIIRKEEQYKSGFLDSSYLNQAILSKNSLERSLIDMKSSRFDFVKTFKTYSDMDIQNIKLPVFSLINESKFLKKSLAISQKNSEIVKNNYLKKMTESTYLPTISFNAGYYNVHDFGAKKYTNYGLTFSIPLVDINKNRTIQIKKLEYLKSKLELEDIKKTQKENYDSVINKILLLQEKIKLTNRDLKLYDSLLSSTKDSFKAGEKTIYDVNTLKNSKKTMNLDAQIFKLDIQLSLLDLYAQMNGEI